MNKVIFIGNFAGGSFDNPGDPFQVYPYYALTSDLEAFSTSRDGSQLIAFRIKSEAERRLASLSRAVEEEAASARQVRSDRQHRLTMGRNIRAIIERHIGGPVRQLRWSERPPSTSPVGGKSRKALLDGGCDVTADGRSYRVWIGSNGQKLQIVEMPSQSANRTV